MTFLLSHKKAIFLTAIYIIGVQLLYGFESKVDSLKYVLQQYNDEDTSQIHIQTIVALGDALFQGDDLKPALSTFKQGLKLAEKAANTVYVIRCHLAIGDICFWQTDFPCARASLHFVLNAPYPSLTSRDSANALYRLGYVNTYDGNLEKAIAYHVKALKIHERLKDTLKIAHFYSSIGNIKMKQDAPYEALESLEKAIGTYEKLGSESHVIYCFSIKGDAYKKIGDYEKAVFYMGKALAYDLEKGSTYDIGYSCHALASVLIKLGQLERAEELLLQSLEMREKFGDQEEIVESYATLGTLFSHKKNYKKTFEYFDFAITKARELKIRPLTKKVHKQMADAYLLFGQYKDAYLNKEKYYEIKEVLVNEKIEKNIAKLYATHELEKKEQAFDLLTKEREIERLRNKKQLNLLNKWLLVMAAIALSVFTFGGIFLFKKQVDYNKVLTGKNNHIKDQNHNLIAINEKLEQANKDLEQFAYISSHDLKTPLRNIGNYAGLLSLRYAKLLDKDALIFLGFITDGIDQMNALLDNILSYSVVTKSPIKKEIVGLNEIVDKVLHNMKPVIAERQAQVDFQPLLSIEGDPIQIMQVFQNLIGNAIKFVPADRCPMIRICGEELGHNMYKITIIDNGVGIKPEHQDKIFEIFKRLHTATEFKGTGIGLSICKKIINRHGGKIWVTSDGETGTTFHFTLSKSDDTFRGQGQPSKNFSRSQR